MSRKEKHDGTSRPYTKSNEDRLTEISNNTASGKKCSDCKWLTRIDARFEKCHQCDENMSKFERDID